MKYFYKLTCFVGLFFFNFSMVSGQNLPKYIEAATAKFLTDSHLNHALTGLSVVHARTGELVYAHNGEIGLAPGSTLKVVTAASAYYQLGPHFTYKTQLAYDGTIENGILKGNLHILGAGDPTLGSEHHPSSTAETILENWKKSLTAAGITQITGRIIGDGRVFGTQSLPEKWIWEDIGNYYGAGNSGLSWRENRYQLFLKPGNTQGEKVQVIGSEPPLHGLTFINELKTGSANSGDQTYIFAAPYTSIAYLRGTAPANHPNFNVSGSVPEPALYAARNLEQYLKKAGIAINGQTSTARILENLGKEPATRLKVLHTHQSPTLEEINDRFLKKSVNLYGEHLVKTIALQSQKEISTAEGIEVIQDLWQSKGVDKAALHLLDGSGLSPSNRITPNALTTVLVQTKKEGWFKSYYENFPVIHNIRMKSGFIHGAVAYTGFLETTSGESLVFSFMVNNFEGSAGKIRPRMFALLDEIKRY